MDRLVGARELLDGPLDDRPALVANLRDLARLNRLTGGTRLSSRSIWRLLDGSTGGVTILDVGTGGADIPIALLAEAARRGRSLDVTATDSRREVLDAAIAARPTLRAVRRLHLAIADGRGLPYPDQSFDVAHASLVLHHLERNDAIAFLRELRRVARRGIVVNDLIRSRLNWVGAEVIVRAVARGRYTRHDGPLSVRRAFSRRELAELVDAASLRTIATEVGFAAHRLAIAAV
jgi:ubiquinone/menaquinone biosynthesis C-methylase UbiE